MLNIRIIPPKGGSPRPILDSFLFKLMMSEELYYGTLKYRFTSPFSASRSYLPKYITVPFSPSIYPTHLLALWKILLHGPKSPHSSLFPLGI